MGSRINDTSRKPTTPACAGAGCANKFTQLSFGGIVKYSRGKAHKSSKKRPTLQL
ncbi:MAG: hypothetical protein WB290_07460 [Smithella sp.]